MPVLSIQQRVIALFVIHAIASGAIHTRMPDVQVGLGLSEGALGLTLMGLPLGALSMFLFSSRIIERFGPRRVILFLLPLVTLSSALITLAPNGVVVFLLLALNGIGFSVSNIAMNVEADRVEAAGGRRVMNTCHGAWSAGFLATALLGVLMRGLGVSPALHLWVLMPLVTIGIFAIVVPMQAMPARAYAGKTSVKKLAWPTLANLALVGFGLGAGLLEGACRAWSIIYMRDTFSVPAWIESLSMPAVLVAMALGRLLADRFIDTFGNVTVARSLIGVALAGLCLVVWAPAYWLVLIGFVLIGLGICVLYPLMLSAAARLGDRPASQNVAATTLIIQCVNLGAPSAIGAMAEHFGIRTAFAAMLPLLLLSLAMSGTIRSKEKRPAL